jgi:hypothetical protein
MARDEVRRNFRGDNYALTTERTTVVALATDAFTESQNITALPDGLTLMGVTAGANWGPSAGQAGHVLTERNGLEGKQTFNYATGELSYERYYRLGGWGPWVAPGAAHIHTNLPHSAYAESDPGTFYPAGYSNFFHTGNEWGPANEPGMIESSCAPAWVFQTFTGANNRYWRYWDGGSWLPWHALDGAGGGWTEVDASTTAKGISKLSVAPASATDPIAAGTNDPRLSDARTPTVHGASHAWGGADPVRPGVRALQTIGVAGAIAVGSDGVILVTATADRTGVTLDAGAFDGQFIAVINRSAFSLTFNATDATSRVFGGGAIAPTSRFLVIWDANFGGASVGRWVKLAVDSVAAIASMRTLGTGASQAAAGNDARLSDARTPTTREWQAVFFYGGTLATQVGVGKFKLPNTGNPTITEVTIEVDALPTGQNVFTDLNSVNAATNAKTTLYATQANRPAIPPGGNYSNVATLPNTTQPGAGVSLSVDIDQIGSGTPGSNLVVIVRGTY